MVVSWWYLESTYWFSMESIFLVLRSRTIYFGLDSCCHPIVIAFGKLSRLHFSTDFHEIWFQHGKYLGPVQVEVHFAKIAFRGVQGSKNSEMFAVFSELEIGKLCWVYISTNVNEIWFQHRKYLKPVQVEVHFVKITFGGGARVQKGRNSNYWLIAKQWIASRVELPPPLRCLTVSTLFTPFLGSERRSFSMTILS